VLCRTCSACICVRDTVWMESRYQWALMGLHGQGMHIEPSTAEPEAGVADASLPARLLRTHLTQSLQDRGAALPGCNARQTTGGQRHHSSHQPRQTSQWCSQFAVESSTKLSNVSLYWRTMACIIPDVHSYGHMNRQSQQVEGCTGAAETYALLKAQTVFKANSLASLPRCEVVATS
jgi:hypothetical protein